MVYTITADSIPDYDEWGPDDYWSCADWITWHKAMKSKYGKDEANRRFLSAFHQAGFLASSYDCRSFNSEFRQYSKDNGFYDGLYDGLAVITQPIGVGTDVVNAAGQTVSNISQGISNTSKAAKYAIPAVILVVSALVLMWFYRKFVVVGR